MSSEAGPDRSLFLDILRNLEAIDAPYVIIGAFAAAIYGSSRATYDIDIVVDLREDHIRRLAAAYPSPRYYADPVQMRDSIRMGIMFNIIDAWRGEKADLIPLTMTPWYRHALRRRVRQEVAQPDGHLLLVWCARPDDVIVGKLMAWQQGRSQKHASDIRDMLVFHYLNPDAPDAAMLDEAYITTQALQLGPDVAGFWKALRDSARSEV